MPLEIKEYDNGATVEVIASGKLSQEDYEDFIPYFEKRLEQHGSIGILFVMEDFGGFEMWALWEDIKFEWKHYDDIRRLAMVGESTWQEWMSIFCKPFVKSDVQYFEPDNIEEARRWVRGGDEPDSEEEK